MNGYRERTKRTISMLLCIVFVFCTLCMPALAEETPATPTDLAEAAEPFEWTETVEGVRITVTVRNGTGIADGEAPVIRTADADFVLAAEETLGIEQNDGRIIRHAVYRFFPGKTEGTGKVKMEKLGLTALQEMYPGSRISVYVLRYDETAPSRKDRARSIPAIVQTERNAITFSLPEPGLYDVLTFILLRVESLPEKGYATETEDENDASE
ncbi:MAG: hypothetical protein J6Y48_20190, partial [Clostridia bacterium]|nr:hypothetical protein [Clostridia bacterium]